jgi:hypothetical protein
MDMMSERNSTCGGSGFIEFCSLLVGIAGLFIAISERKSMPQGPGGSNPQYIQVEPVPQQKPEPKVLPREQDQNPKRKKSFKASKRRYEPSAAQRPYDTGWNDYELWGESW